MRKHVRHLLSAQRDILSPQAIGGVTAAINELNIAMAGGHTGKIRIKMEELEFAANKWIKPYPNPLWRENVEVLLVALGVAMAIRTFFLQPFKIPTGSMQPTLYGVTSEPDFTPSKIDYWQEDKRKEQAELFQQVRLRETVTAPTGWERVKEWFEGISYVHFVAPTDGTLDEIGPPWPPAIFSIYQNFKFAGVWHTIWFPPDYGESNLAQRDGLDPGKFFYHKGDVVFNIRVHSGDHLFVDRLTYNFRKPERGEIIVFETQGITNLAADQQGTFYIKRLVALPGERVQIGDDRHLIINGQRLDASTPHFAGVYGFDTNTPPRESEFSGHVNGTVAREYDLYPNLAPLFPDAETVVTNGPDSYMVMGDNTCNSSDSRTWGSFPTEKVIGKSFFVYWPITSRFGVDDQ